MDQVDAECEPTNGHEDAEVRQLTGHTESRGRMDHNDERDDAPPDETLSGVEDSVLQGGVGTTRYIEDATDEEGQLTRDGSHYH